jgi:hypothetical protein
MEGAGLQPWAAPSAGALHSPRFECRFQAKRLRATKLRAMSFRGRALARCPRAAVRTPCARRPRRWRKSGPLCTLRNRRRHPCPRNTRASRHRVSPCPACMGSRFPRCLAAPASRQRWRPRRPRLRRTLMLSIWHRHMTRRACQQTDRAPERSASLYRECTGSHCRRCLED